MSDLATETHPQLRAAVRAAVRASAPRPAAARRAANDFQRSLLPAVWAEVRWAFTPPRTWLMGVVANLVFAAGWLLVQPLTPHGRHPDWVLLVGTYFSSWVLADVTTTNLLGADHYRLQQALSDGTPFWRLLLIKNLALLVIVALPTLLAAVVVTLWLGRPEHLLAITLPTVLVPILSWLGVGNLISAVHPVSVEPLFRRWRHRHDARRIGSWILALTLPYALYYVADPTGSVEHRVLWQQLPRLIWPIFGRDTKGFAHLAVALLVWVVGSVAAVLWVRRRGLDIR